MGASSMKKAVEILLMRDPCQARVGLIIFLILSFENSEYSTWISPKEFLGIVFGKLNVKTNKSIIFFGRS